MTLPLGSNLCYGVAGSSATPPQREDIQSYFLLGATADHHQPTSAKRGLCQRARRARRVRERGAAHRLSRMRRRARLVRRAGGGARRLALARLARLVTMFRIEETSRAAGFGVGSYKRDGVQKEKACFVP